MPSRFGPLCVVFVMLAAFAPAQVVKKELEGLQGNWTLDSVEHQNGPTKDLNLRLAIKGNQSVISLAGSKKSYDSTIKIDPTMNPKTIDFVYGNGATFLGIYKLEGDVLTICRSGNSGQARPTQFKAGQLDNLFVWKREKK